MTSAEYPKWVSPHISHVVTKDGNVSTPAFAQFHVQRVTADVTVLVVDEDEEACALAPFVPPNDSESPRPKLVKKS